jgi:type VI secretion system secreted protein Hcp
MAVDMFLHIDDLKGESQDSKHKDDIEVLSWSWGAAQHATMTGGGLGAGKVSIQDITITKKVDRSSPNIFKMCCMGTHMKKGALTVRKAGGDALEYLVLQFEEMMWTSYSVSGASGDEIIENVSFTFVRCGLTYTPQVGSGSGDAKISGGWDLQANKEFEPK